LNNPAILGNAVLYNGDCLSVLRTLPANSVQCVVTSPPYWGLRDYGVDGQIGLESSPDEYVARMVAVFAEVRRVLREDGTCWLNLGDSYCSIGHKKSGSGNGTTGLSGGKAQDHFPIRRENNGGGLKHKDLIGIPWRVAFALQADGWYLRQDIIWHKPNSMPESVTDRCTKSHEYIFMLTKSARYFYDAEAVMEDAITNAKSKNWTEREYDQSFLGTKQKNGVKGRPIGVAGYAVQGKRNRRSVWSIATQPFSGAHFAVFPPALVEPCVLAGSSKNSIVLDPFSGSGTAGLVAIQHGRRYVGIELNPDYFAMSRQRIEAAQRQQTLELAV
jgi:DNA modification methylase